LNGSAVILKVFVVGSEEGKEDGDDGLSSERVRL